VDIKKENVITDRNIVLKIFFISTKVDLDKINKVEFSYDLLVLFGWI